MRFRTWLSEQTELLQSSKRVRWDFKATLPALGINGVKKEPVLHARGTHADIYVDPTDPNRIVKLTNDIGDVRNTVTAQRLKSRNVVKCYGTTREGVMKGAALLMDFVRGESASYSNSEFLALLEGKDGMEPRSNAYMRIMRPDEFRSGILDRHGLLDKTELFKLSQLFKTIFLLEERLGIFLADLVENVIDIGNAYVIVDFGG